MGRDRRPSVARTSLFRRAADRMSLGGSCIEFWNPPENIIGIGTLWESLHPMDRIVPDTVIRGVLAHAAGSCRAGRKAHSIGRNR
jgi:hypothetical protein